MQAPGTGSASPKTPTASIKSALRKRGTNGADESRPPRWDAHGNQISPTSTGYHMTFADQQSGKIEEVREVKAFKNQQPGCGCTVS
jgi:hypothetical protein